MMNLFFKINVARIGVLCLILLLAGHEAFGQISYYEAESSLNTLQNKAAISSCSGCSGGAKVNYLGGSVNGKLIFSKIHVVEGGSCLLTLFYVSGDNRSLFYSVNNSTPCKITCESTGGWDKVAKKDILVRLKAGDNTIAFDNPYEYAADVDKIGIQKNTTVPVFRISGHVKNRSNKLLSQVEVRLTGAMEETVKTNNKGYYEFNYLPQGAYCVTPVLKRSYASPFDSYYTNLKQSADNTDFTFYPAARSKDTVIMAGNWKMTYDLANGRFSVSLKNKQLLNEAYSAVRTPAKLTTMNFRNRKITSSKESDLYGDGKHLVIDSWNTGSDHLKQHFFFYPDKDYCLTYVEFIRKGGVSTNYIAPLVTDSLKRFLPDGDNRVLFVPYDNDMWVRFNAWPYNSDVTSYEVTALYNNASRVSFVVGALGHDTWKSAVTFKGATGPVASLEVYGGASSAITHDVIPHGYVSGDTVKSPKIFMGYFDDWRAGLETYAKANAAITPPAPWNKGIPFGWNSWGKIQNHLTYDKAKSVSDFFATELVPKSFFTIDSLVYIGLDAFWDNLKSEELTSFVENCKKNHQAAGIYWTPFADWGKDGNRKVEGTSYLYKDIYLYANGSPISLDGAYAVDPTHPGTKQRMDYYADKFKKDGYKYVKLDFMTHGALESDSHYDSKVTTGVAAYNQGMRYLADKFGSDMYMNLSIAPVFPAQYAQSRRIACDAFGDIGHSEYTMNAVTYGWWLSYIYDYNDADHIVLEGFSEGENRARVTSSVITGIVYSGDDLSSTGSEATKEKARKFLTNPEINAIARTKKSSFRPVEGNTGSGASTMFVYETPEYAYLAVFNFQPTEASFSIDLKRLGLSLPDSVEVKELWSSKIFKASGSMTINIGAKDAMLFKISKK